MLVIVEVYNSNYEIHCFPNKYPYKNCIPQQLLAYTKEK